MQDDDLKVLEEGVARNWTLVVTLPSAGMLRHHKSRFLSLDAGGIWIECPPDGPLIDELIGTQGPVGISFKGSRRKVVFTARLLERREEFKLNDETIVPALLIKRPQELKVVQRRNSYRVQVLSDSDIHVRIWRIGPSAPLSAVPMSVQEVKARMCDLSTGGLGLLIDGDAASELMADERLRISIVYQNDSLLLEGHLSHKGPAVGSRRGVMFKNLEADLEGRQHLATLTRIVGELQREARRRARLGFSV